MNNSDSWLKIPKISVPLEEEINILPDTDYVFMGVVSLHTIEERHDGRKTYVLKLTGDYSLINK